jgi:DNA replication factor GINS
MPDVIITYETLYEILRREKGREELSKLDQNFYRDTLTYLIEKQAILDKSQTDMFAKEEHKKTTMLIENVKKLVQEIYTIRERKVLLMAHDSVKVREKIIDTESMLPQEKTVYDHVVQSLVQERKQTLNRVLNLESPEIKEKQIIEEKPKDLKINPSSGQLIRFVKEVPKFMGTDLQVYGPYKAEDMAKLPTDIAQLLIKKEKAEIIEEN